MINFDQFILQLCVSNILDLCSSIILRNSPNNPDPSTGVIWVVPQIFFPSLILEIVRYRSTMSSRLYRRPIIARFFASHFTVCTEKLHFSRVPLTVLTDYVTSLTVS